MKQGAFGEVVRKFFKTTTLHGFKYVISHYYSDRLPVHWSGEERSGAVPKSTVNGQAAVFFSVSVSPFTAYSASAVAGLHSICWVSWCVASACCAGVLCTVLWERFLKVPALLALRDSAADLADFQQIPTVAICQPARLIAQAFLKHLNTNNENTSRIPETFANALRGLPAEADQVELLERLFSINNVSLLQVLHAYTPLCCQLTRRCRWQNTPVACELLFEKEVTTHGVCCVASPERLQNVTLPTIRQLHSNRRLEMALHCPNGSLHPGCEFFTMYRGEEWVTPSRIKPGYDYVKELTFTLEKDSNDDKLVGGSCVSSSGYSRTHCLLKCTESRCGCSDPLRNTLVDERNVPPPCPMTMLSCLRTFGLEVNSTCSCLPACKKILTKQIIESSPFSNVDISLDPLHEGLNTTELILLRLKVNCDDSKIFAFIPTETWLTLLSSLGGVFNMFLGVGLFSALEFLFCLLVRFPIAFKKSPEMVTPLAIHN